MRKFLTFSSFAIASMGVMAMFITSTSFMQLGFAIILYPMLVYFAFKAFPRRAIAHSLKIPAIASESSLQVVSEKNEPVEKEESAKTESFGIKDIDKRVFLKLIGGAGLSLFLFSIFNKKAEGLFFKNLPTTGVSGSVSLQDTAGNKIDPAQNHPTDGYRISEIDDNVVTFYGFTNKHGAWFIMKEDTDTGSFRYSKGDSNFPVGWTDREKLKYDYFNDVF